MDYRWFSLIGFSLLLSACTEEILLAPSTSPPQLVIEGQISNERKEHLVSVSRSGDHTHGHSPEPVSGLQIILSGPEGTTQLRETTAGKYRTDSLAGLPGATYTLQVNDGSRIYRASDTMPAVPEDFEPAEFSRHGEYLDYEFRRHQFGFTSANRWELYVIRDSLPEELAGIDPAKLGQQLGVEVSLDYSYRFTFYTHPKLEVSGLMDFEIPHFYGFPAGFHVVQKKYNLSAAYYQFLRALFMETEWRGTLFSTVPANVRGNFDQDALGYFSAVSTLTRSFIPE